MTETNLPDAQTLISAARTAMEHVRVPADPDAARERRRKAAGKALDQWAPAIDELTDISGAARFLGLKGPDSLRRMQWAVRADGTRKWPEHDAKFGRSKVWKYRTIVIHQAEAPGKGHPGARLGRINAHKRKPLTA